MKSKFFSENAGEKAGKECEVHVEAGDIDEFIFKDEDIKTVSER